MTKNKKSEIIEVDLKEFFENLTTKENIKEIDFEKALSLALLYALKKFNNTSEQTKYDLKAMAILSKSCPIIKNLVNEIRERKKDYKRKRSNELKSIIKDISKNMKIREIDNDNTGLFSRLIHKGN